MQSAYGDICHDIIKSHANSRQHEPNPKHNEEVIQKDDSSALFVKASYSPDLQIFKSQIANYGVQACK